MAILNINLRKSLTKNTLQYILNTGSRGFFRKIKEDSIPHTGLSAQGSAEILRRGSADNPRCSGKSQRDPFQRTTPYSFGD